MKKFFKFLAFSTIALSILASIAGYRYYTFLQTPLSTAPQGSIFAISTGTPVYKIANDLAEAGVIKSSGLFLFAIYTQGNWHKLKAGEYLIKPGSTPVDLINQLRDGKVIQYPLTIVPGWTFERLMQEIEASPKIQHSLTGLNAAEIMAKLGYAAKHPEGQFFPETYYYPAGTTDVALLQRAHRDLQAKLTLLWNAKKTDCILKSDYEALILASIIEKESSVIDEYRDIAGVYTRRLAKNMPLQADPTVIYGADKAHRDAMYQGGVTNSMLNHQNPYNTYLKTGLPPTPIALPSARALEAALDPKAGEALYFVAKPDGKGHVFSDNLAAHNIAAAKYRKGLVNINTKGIP